MIIIIKQREALASVVQEAKYLKQQIILVHAETKNQEIDWISSWRIPKGSPKYQAVTWTQNDIPNDHGSTMGVPDTEPSFTCRYLHDERPRWWNIGSIGILLSPCLYDGQVPWSISPVQDAMQFVPVIDSTGRYINLLPSLCDADHWSGAARKGNVIAGIQRRLYPNLARHPFHPQVPRPRTDETCLWSFRRWRAAAIRKMVLADSDAKKENYFPPLLGCKTFLWLVGWKILKTSPGND